MVAERGKSQSPTLQLTTAPEGTSECSTGRDQVMRQILCSDICNGSPPTNVCFLDSNLSEDQFRVKRCRGARHCSESLYRRLL
jgi:hypothetical protein